MNELSQPSVMTAFITMLRPTFDSGQPRAVGYGSGFLAESVGGLHLITNWHVFTGRDPLTDSPKGSAAKPYQAQVAIFGLRADGQFVRATFTVDIYDPSGAAAWKVHPVHGRRIDVVALQLPALSTQEDRTLLPYSLLDSAQPAVISPTSDVSIVGYPDVVRGRTEAAIWTRATVASEPDLDYDDLPCFLVDARGREGQSGAPVIGYWTPERPKLTKGNNISLGYGESWELFGVYSGRIAETSDLGRVWKRSAVQAIVEHGTKDSYTNED